MVIKRSLTKQLMQQGGNVKIGLRKSNTTRNATNNGSSKDYSTFLNQMKSFKKNVYVKSKQRSSKKKRNNSNTNKTLEIIPQKQPPNPNPVKPSTIPKSMKPSTNPKPMKPSVNPQSVKKEQGKKINPVNNSRSNKKNNIKKSFTKNKLKKRSYKKMNPKRKNIVVSMPKSVDSKNVENIQKKIKDIKSKSKSEMIKELNKEGVKISGKDETIIRDIYLYSKLCGINIKK
jgi:hypothetical protein